MSVSQFYVAPIAQLSARAPSRVTGVVEETAAEHTHGVRQDRVMKLVVLLRVFDVVVLDEAMVVGSFVPLCSISSKLSTFSGSEGCVIGCKIGLS